MLPFGALQAPRFLFVSGFKERAGQAGAPPLQHAQMRAHTKRHVSCEGSAKAPQLAFLERLGNRADRDEFHVAFLGEPYVISIGSRRAGQHQCLPKAALGGCAAPLQDLAYAVCKTFSAARPGEKHAEDPACRRRLR